MTSSTLSLQKDTSEQVATPRPRLGFLGVGWIGRHRLEALVASDVVEVVAVADASANAISAIQSLVPHAAIGTSLDELLGRGLDGVVIATPSALHAEQTITALKRGCAVFCQKPLARTTDETRAIIDAAQRADRLLGVDFSYRHVRAVAEMRNLVRSGAIGNVFAAELVFHNAYGPDKPWFFDPSLSGGGCLIDLGSHLVDLALWVFDFAPWSNVSSRLYREGKPLSDPTREVEDFAVAQWEMQNGATVRLTCSWNISAGCDAVIGATFFGTSGAVSLRNVGGSFYDFTVERFAGTARDVLSSGPDLWGGRAALAWAQQLADGGRFDAQAAHFIEVAELIDGIYER